MPPPPTVPVPAAPLEAPAASVRPTIKLKHNVSAPKVSETSKSSSKSKVRKPPAVDVPPPPYIDDGSHDLLQEVIAMEMEKDGKRHRPTSERAAEKRKRSIDDDDEEILSLAPAITSKRKLPPSASAPSRLIGASANGTSPKSSPGPSAPKNPSRPEPPAPQPPKLKLSIKGKEKEAASVPVAPAPTPSSKPRKSPAGTATPLNEKKCREVLKALLKMPEAAIFSRPVDAVLDGCPTYVYIITIIYLLLMSSAAIMMRSKSPWISGQCLRS